MPRLRRRRVSTASDHQTTTARRPSECRRGHHCFRDSYSRRQAVMEDDDLSGGQIHGRHEQVDTGQIEEIHEGRPSLVNGPPGNPHSVAEHGPQPAQDCSVIQEAGAPADAAHPVQLGRRGHGPRPRSVSAPMSDGLIPVAIIAAVIAPADEPAAAENHRPRFRTASRACGTGPLLRRRPRKRHGRSPAPDRYSSTTECPVLVPARSCRTSRPAISRDQANHFAAPGTGHRRRSYSQRQGLRF